MLKTLPRRQAAVAVLTAILAVSLPTPARTEGQDAGGAPGQARHTRVLWLDHFGLLPGSPELNTSFRSTTSCPGFSSCLTGLVAESSTLGDTFSSGGNKVVHMAAGVPPGWLVSGVRVCYELSSADTFITQVRLAQVQDPPASALIRLDDGTDLTAQGPVCVNSAAPFNGTIDPEQGSLLVSLRLNYADTSDRIVVRGLGLLLQKH